MTRRSGGKVESVRRPGGGESESVRRPGGGESESVRRPGGGESESVSLSGGGEVESMRRRELAQVRGLGFLVHFFPFFTMVNSFILKRSQKRQLAIRVLPR
jgi:hypothetical protein